MHAYSFVSFTFLLSFPPSSSESYAVHEYSEISLPFHLDGVSCSGSESNISECEHNGIGIYNCNRDKVAAVICTGWNSTIYIQPAC